MSTRWQPGVPAFSPTRELDKTGSGQPSCGDIQDAAPSHTAMSITKIFWSLATSRPGLRTTMVAATLRTEFSCAGRIIMRSISMRSISDCSDSARAARSSFGAVRPAANGNSPSAKRSAGPRRILERGRRHRRNWQRIASGMAWCPADGAFRSPVDSSMQADSRSPAVNGTETRLRLRPHHAMTAEPLRTVRALASSTSNRKDSDMTSTLSPWTADAILDLLPDFSEFEAEEITLEANRGSERFPRLSARQPLTERVAVEMSRQMFPELWQRPSQMCELFRWSNHDS